MNSAHCCRLVTCATLKIVSSNNLLTSSRKTIDMQYVADPDPYDRTQLDFGQLIQSTIQDTQNRIVFRAQSVIRDDIEGFSPKPEDLDYPAKNQLPKKPIGDGEIPGTPLPNAPTIIDRDDNPSGNGFDTEAVFKGWYPTLRKCIWLLSRIYRLVNVGATRMVPA